MKKLLITGQNSYIGTSFEQWVKEKCPEEISIDFLNLRESNWQEKSFASYDSIFHVAGIAHVDAKKISREEQEIYYKVNRDLTVELAAKAKAEGVKQFIFMSSIIIYGKLEHITRNTQPAPENFYGDSKLQADLALQKISDKNFKVSIIRSPMVYGKSCKGNYRLLSFIARHAPFFPDYENKISMIYIENLCALIEKIILKEAEGIFFPQNSEYVNTSNMVREIAKSYGHKILISKKLNWLVKIGTKIPGPIQKKIHKAFRNMTYEKNLSEYDFEYRLVNFEDSIKKISS
ncbi:MAG: NAD-dependent epimerase/dehydratase family protein [Synergistaceae bacterium]|nr:NAD-dependent epimerase/dehydratase family protein [Synergistaceae bacterium]